MAEELVGPGAYSFNLTVETPLDIDTMIYMLAPEDLPLIHGVNSDGVPLLPQTPANDITVYWLEENVPLPRSKLAAALADGVATSLTLPAGGAVKFAVGDGIRIENEVMIVTGVNTTTETLTVTRGTVTETNTTGAAHPINAEVIGLGSILAEGAVGSTNFQGRDRYFNTCQIWSKKLTMSATEQNISKYGIPSELAHQLVNQMHNAGVGIEQAALYGVRHTVPSGANSFRRQTGGLKYYLASNIDTTSAWITVDSIQIRQQAAYDLGGMFDYIMARPAAFGALDNTMGSQRIQTVTIDDAARGRKRAMSVITEFGEIGLARNRWCKITDAFGVKRSGFGLRKFRPMQVVHLAKVDDTDSYMCVTEAAFQVKGEAHMTAWTALDPTAALPAGLV
jgi:hypothetical protein